jgi:hypothetical protein
LGKNDKKNRLQPKIMAYLEKNGQTRLDILIENLFMVTMVTKDKIELRIRSWWTKDKSIS